MGGTGVAITADVVSYNTVMAACMRGQEWYVPLVLLRTMLESRPRPDTVSFRSGIVASGRIARWQQALGHLHAMTSYRALVDITHYAAATGALGRATKWQLAVALLQKTVETMSIPRVGSPNAISLGYQYHATFAACERGGQWQLALQLLEKMRSVRVDVAGNDRVGYFHTLAAAAKAGHTRVATALYKEAVASGAVTGAGARKTPSCKED